MKLKLRHTNRLRNARTSTSSSDHPPYVTPTDVPFRQHAHRSHSKTKVPSTSDLVRFFIGTTHGVKTLGHGVAGGVVSVPLREALRDHLTRRMSRLTGLVGNISSIPHSGIVAIKFVPILQSEPDIFAQFLRELRIQHALTTAPPITIGSRVFDVSSVVPHVLCGGFLAVNKNGTDGAEAFRVGVIVMHLVPGRTMDTMIKKHTAHLVPAWIVASLEYAICCLFLNGYIHADLHMNNIFVDTHTRKIMIIDFGRAIRMPEHMRRTFETYLVTKGSTALDAFWHNVAQPYADLVIHTRFKAPGATNSARYWTNVIIVNILARHATPGLNMERHRYWYLTNNK